MSNFQALFLFSITVFMNSVYASSSLKESEPQVSERGNQEQRRLSSSKAPVSPQESDEAESIGTLRAGTASLSGSTPLVKERRRGEKRTYSQFLSQQPEALEAEKKRD